MQKKFDVKSLSRAEPRDQNLKEALQWGACELKKMGIKSADLDAELLLLTAIKRQNNVSRCRNGMESGKAWLYTHLERRINKKQLTLYKKFIARRVKHEPIAYILNRKEFYGLDFYVNKNVLIPRPETELVVDETLKQLTTNNQQLTKKTILIDIGTGSGCIPIAVAKSLNNELRIMNYGLDISEKALNIARQNAKLHGVNKKIKFIKSNLLKDIQSSLFIISANGGSARFAACLTARQARRASGGHNSILIITANLPYLTAKQCHTNPDLQWEPREALIADSGGLKYYRQLLKQILTLAKYDSLPIICFFEIDPGQKAKMEKLIKKILPKSKIKFVRDLSKRWRVVRVEI